MIGAAKNITIIKPKTNMELFAEYSWADLLVLTLKPNSHASGLTVLQEAALLGIPIVCSDTGGLRAYFSDSEVQYVTPGNADSLQQGILDLMNDQNAREVLARNAQARMGPEGLSSVSYAKRHVEISYRLLNLKANPS